MENSTAPFDWVEDVCWIEEVLATSYENKIYSVGGNVGFSINDTFNEVTDPYLRIVDFSEPLDSSEDSIDISTDRITTTIRLPDNIPRLEDGIVWISNGFMYMLPGDYILSDETADEYGNIITIKTPGLKDGHWNLKNKVWNFNLSSQAWGVEVSGLGEEYNNPELSAAAFDAKTQVLWYYGGLASDELYRLDKGVGTPIEVKTNSSLVGQEPGVVTRGMLVYIESAGKGGILVLLGGIEGIAYDEKLPRSMKTVHVLDIATKTWFAQSTTIEEGLYPDSTNIRYCSVVASAEDNSSHNIYLYTGPWNPARSKVFILTLPAFIWVPVYEPEGEAPEDEAHKDNYLEFLGSPCLKVHEKHMVVYRGLAYDGHDGCDYDKGSKRYQGMQIYDMSSLMWTTKVELKNPKYLVPELLYNIIGGNATGYATTTEPSRGFQDPKLAQVFDPSITTTPTETTPTETTPTETTPTATKPARTKPATKLVNDDHSGPPVGAISGGVFGGFVLVLLITTVFILRKRKRQRQMEVPPQSTTEPPPPPPPLKPQEMQAWELHELSHGYREDIELPSAPISGFPATGRMNSAGGPYFVGQGLQ